MALTFRKLHPHFVAEVGPIDLRGVHDPDTLAGIRTGMDEYAVLVFHDQPFADTTYRRELRRVTTLDVPEPAFTPSART